MPDSNKLEPLPRTSFTEMKFFYHYNAICYAQTGNELDTVSKCIRATVPASHPEKAVLVELGKKRRQQILEHTEQGANH